MKMKKVLAWQTKTASEFLANDVKKKQEVQLTPASMRTDTDLRFDTPSWLEAESMTTRLVKD